MNPILARLAKAGKLPEQAQAVAQKLPPEGLSQPAATAAKPATQITLFDASLDTPVGQAVQLPKASASIDEALERSIGLCLDLRQALTQALPQVDIYLMEMNTQLREYPELMQLLDDEAIASVYAALRAKTNVAITVAKSKSTKSKGLLDTGESIGDLL